MRNAVKHLEKFRNQILEEHWSTGAVGSKGIVYIAFGRFVKSYLPLSHYANLFCQSSGLQDAELRSFFIVSRSGGNKAVKKGRAYN